MEQITTQQNQTEHSSPKEQRAFAMQQVVDSIESLKGEGLGIERLGALRRLYEEVKGKDYRREQALAKLVEYYEFELKVAEELRLRSKEIISIYPGAEARLFSTAANDQRFNNPGTEDKKYSVG